MTDFVIRRCRRDDLSNVVELCRKHAEHEQAPFDITNKELLLAQAIFNTPAVLHCWVVEIAGMCVGYYTYTFDFSTWDARPFLYLDCLYLETGYRGLGIGKEIMNKLIQEAQSNRCVNIQWQTPTFNIDAIKFYHAIGANAKQKERFTYTL